MKRITSLFLSIAVLFTMCGVTFSVSAEDIQVTEMLYEDFEDDTYGFVPDVRGGAEISYDSVSNNSLYGHAVKMDLTNSSLGDKQYNMNSKDAYVRNNDGANLYSEVSFDITPALNNLRPMYVYLKNAAANKNLLTLKWQYGKFIVIKDGAEREISTYQDGQMINVRVILQFTDSDGATVDKVNGIYVNDALISGDIYPFNFENQGTGKFDQISTLIAKRAEGQALSVTFDNVRIVKYQSPDGSSPMAENRNSLAASIGTLYSFIKTNDAYIDEADKTELNTVLDDAVSLCKSSYATTADVENMIQTVTDTIQNCHVVIPKYQTVLFENFDGDLSYKEETGGNVLPRLIDTYLDGEMYHKSLKVDLSGKTPAAEGAKTGYWYSICASDEIDSAFYRNTESELMYAETEFDISPFGTLSTGRPLYVYLDNATANKNLAFVSFDSGNIRSNIGKIGTYEDGEKMHIKIVQQFNDTDGNTYEKVTAIYKNGELLAQGLNFESEGTGKYDRVRIFAAVQYSDKSEVGCYFDNLCITKYRSESGVSEAPPRMEAAANLNNAYEKLSKTEINEAKKAELKQKLDVLSESYAASNSKEDVTNVYTGAISVLNEIDFEEQSENIKMYAPVTIGTENNDSIYMYSDLFSKTSLDNVYTVAALLKKSDKLVSGEYVQGDVNKLEIAANGKAAVSAEFNLSDYDAAERENLIIKVFAFALNGENDVKLLGSYSVCGDNAEFSADKYIFGDDINVYQQLENNSSEEINKLIVTSKGDKSSDAMMIQLKKGITLAEFMAKESSDEIINSIEAINAETSDSNGRAAFEQIPAGGTGEYVVIAANSAKGKAVTKGFYETSYIDTVINALYSEKNAETVDTYKEFLGIEGSVYSAAVSNSLDIDKEVKALLNATTYTKYDINQFGKALLERLSAISSFYDAKNVDSVELALSEYSKYITNYGNLKNIRSTATYIYDNRKSIKSIDALNTVFDAAVKNGSSNNSNTGGSGSGGGGGKGGSNVSYGSDGILSPGMVGNDANSSAMQEYLNAYDDLDGYDWVKEAIIALSTKGYISGKGDKKFAPGDNITREEFVKIAVLVFGIYNENATTDFADVKTSDWFYKYVASACENEIINGVEEGVFGTGRNLSREDLAVIIYRMMKKTNVNFTEDGEYIEFVDEGLFSDYAGDAIKELAKSGVVNGIGNNEFAPKNLCTRAEATKMLYVAYKLKEGAK